MLTAAELADLTDEERGVLECHRHFGGEPRFERLAIAQAHEVFGLGEPSEAFRYPAGSVAQPLRPRRAEARG